MSYTINKNANGDICLVEFTNESLGELDDILKYITCINEGVFEGSNLENIVIPNNINKIGRRAFKNCKNLKRVVLGNGIKEIPIDCFAKCDSLEKIIIPEGVNLIWGFAFSDCSKLKSIQLPTTLKEIGSYAFCRCPKLKSITIPKDTICTDAFIGNEHYVTIKRIDYENERLIKQMIGRYRNKVVESGQLIDLEDIASLENSLVNEIAETEELLIEKK